MAICMPYFDYQLVSVPTTPLDLSYSLPWTQAFHTVPLRSMCSGSNVSTCSELVSSWRSWFARFRNRPDQSNYCCLRIPTPHWHQVLLSPSKVLPLHWPWFFILLTGSHIYWLHQRTSWTALSLEHRLVLRYGIRLPVFYCQLVSVVATTSCGISSFLTVHPPKKIPTPSHFPACAWRKIDVCGGLKKCFVEMSVTHFYNSIFIVYPANANLTIRHNGVFFSTETAVFEAL